MRQFFLVLLLAWCVVLTGCAESPAPAVDPPSDGTLGYLIGNDEIIFRFDASEFEEATRNDTGRWLAISDVDIETVTVAGEFNGWSKEAWQMQDAGEGIWELRKNLAFFNEGSELEFKFVLNGFFWVEPPADARNSTASGMYKANRSYNLILRVP